MRYMVVRDLLDLGECHVDFQEAIKEDEEADHRAEHRKNQFTVLDCKHVARLIVHSTKPASNAALQPLGKTCIEHFTLRKLLIRE
mmetsp:Transcript_5746/g.13514  ORF Transcript_5746/g.13514 Transcript_5746/m.13514 type:complete len:85 (+) Transcript_5746:345-599(+)